MGLVRRARRLVSHPRLHCARQSLYRDASFGLVYRRAAILYGFAGYIAFTNPLFAAGVLTLWLGIALVVTGVLRIAAAVQWSSARGRGWVIAAGVIAVLAGLLVIFRWPQATPWLLGLFLAIDLTFFGASEIAFGFMLKAAGQERPSPPAAAMPAH